MSSFILSSTALTFYTLTLHFLFSVSPLAWHFRLVKYQKRTLILIEFMISSVIAILDQHAARRNNAISQITSDKRVEIGEVIHRRKLPIAIEADDNQELESITRWIQSIEGVSFVDVVYVQMDG